MFKTILTDYRK